MWDVIMSMEQPDPAVMPEKLPGDYRATVSAMSSTSTLLGQREDTLFRALDNIENNLNTAANISNAIEDEGSKRGEPPHYPPA
mmetsp:Transcript_9300/g.27321  ORF Transcript_9300/g.27321 Transcript_9300/m.27321 type:complete len:83 (+) Transcript_9300:294-542(+)